MIWDLNVHSHNYWLTIFCTTNSSSPGLARKRSQNIENSWEKTQYWINTLYLTSCVPSAALMWKNLLTDREYTRLCSWRTRRTTWRTPTRLSSGSVRKISKSSYFRSYLNNRCGLILTQRWKPKKDICPTYVEFKLISHSTKIAIS